MSSHVLRRTAAAIFLAAALAVPAHALPARSMEPLGFGERFLSWVNDLWSAVWAEDSTPLPPGPGEGGLPPEPGTDEGHMIDPNG